jgi:two-component system, chemotaxis family, chemotaxis protein CheY
MEMGRPNLNHPRVLITDDLKFMRQILRDILERNGFSVAAEAVDGQDAVQRYIRSRPDLVLMDITMPRMDGIQALQRIMQTDARARVVMCSALGQEKFIIRSIQLGARDFVVKPFSEERIVSALTKAFQRG